LQGCDCAQRYGYTRALVALTREGEHYVLTTLDELVEACGDRFGGLDRKYNSSDKTTSWVAKAADCT
jgi:hypothetical protein